MHRVVPPPQDFWHSSGPALFQEIWLWGLRVTNFLGKIYASYDFLLFYLRSLSIYLFWMEMIAGSPFTFPTRILTKFWCSLLLKAEFRPQKLTKYHEHMYPSYKIFQSKCWSDKQRATEFFKNSVWKIGWLQLLIWKIIQISIPFLFFP